MKNFILLLILTTPLAAQSFDMKSLDKIGANARNATNVTLGQEHAAARRELSGRR